MPFRTRGFVITNWNVTDDAEADKATIEAICKAKRIRYLAYGKETCPDTGKLHYQSFLYFANARSTGDKALGAMGSWWGKTHCHVEPMKGSFLSNEKYCSKEGQYTEIGDKPEPGAREDIKENVELIASGEMTADDLCMLDPQHFHMYGRTYDRIEDICARKRVRYEMTKGTWYFGKTGVGKSHITFEGRDPEEFYLKSTTEADAKWWDGYMPNKHRTVIINEFRGGIPYGQMLSLTDKWPEKVSRRGREPMPFTADEIIVTSCHPPEKIYKNVDKDGHAQLYRRFKVYEVTAKGEMREHTLVEDDDDVIQAWEVPSSVLL